MFYGVTAGFDIGLLEIWNELIEIQPFQDNAKIAGETLRTL